MRNRSGQMDGQGQKKFGSSKGFGFVEFEQHSHALKALRYLNNNPTIFTADKRPIVEFSIENKVALNRKKYRQIKQEKMKNQMNQNETIESSLPQQQQQHPSNTYSGVEAKPFDKNEKVPKLKTNKRKRNHKKRTRICCSSFFLMMTFFFCYQKLMIFIFSGFFQENKNVNAKCFATKVF